MSDPHGRAASVWQRCRHLAPGLDGRHVFSHVTALQLWGMPLPARLEHSGVELHVSAARGREPRRPGVAGHRIAQAVDGAEIIGGLRVASPIEAWIQSAPLLTLDELIIVGDALAGRWSRFERARRQPLELLERAVRGATGRPGVSSLREAFDLVRPRVESPRETRLRLLVVRSGLPEFEINVPVRDERGRFVGRPDGQYARHRVAVEYQGDVHRVDRAGWRADIRRRERFEGGGWRVSWATDDDLTPLHAPAYLARLAALLA